MTSNTLTTQLSQVLQFHPHLKQTSVQVQSNRGNVVLTGTVGSYYEKQLAQETLRGVAGIASIDNSLEVNWR